MRKAMIPGAFAALLAVTGCNEKKEASKDVVSFDEVLTTRRSVHSYDASKKISEAEVRELLTATQEAPSVISLGYRAGEPTRPERRPLDDIVKFF